MIFQIRFTSEAEETYRALVAQLQFRWGDKFVSKFEAKVSKAFDTIASDPEIYSKDKYFTNLRRCVVHKNCSMFYKVNHDHIVIVYFWDNRQQPLIF